MNDFINFPSEDFDDDKSVCDPENVRPTTSGSEPAWTKQAVFYLLEEVLLKKWELHDPKHRHDKFYGSIRDLLIANRGLHFTPRAIQKKFRGLKRTFDILCENETRTDNVFRGPKNWPFFDKMMEIFSEELAIEDAPTMASLYPDLPLPRNALPLKVVEEVSEISETEWEDDLEVKPCASSKPVKKQPKTNWSHQVIVDFLTECVLERDAFWDANQTLRDVLTRILAKLQDKGYNFDTDALACKLNNLRGSYRIAATKPKAVYPWPYFDQLHMIFNGWPGRKILLKNAREQNKLKKKPRPHRRKINQERRLKQEAENKGDTKIIWSHFEDIANASSSTNYRKILPKPDPYEEFIYEDTNEQVEPRLEVEPLIKEDFDYSEVSDGFVYEQPSAAEDVLEVNSPTPDSAPPDFDQDFANKLLALELRRTVVTEGLLAEIEASNAIREQKLEFSKAKLAHLKARAKRKHIYS